MTTQLKLVINEDNSKIIGLKKKIKIYIHKTKRVSFLELNYNEYVIVTYLSDSHTFQNMTWIKLKMLATIVQRAYYERG